MTREETPREDSAAMSAHPVRWRGLLAGLGCGTLLLVVGVGLVIFFFRQNLPELSQADFEAAMDRWDEHGPASYDLELELGGARPGTFQVEVRNGRVQSPPRLNGRPVKAQHTWETWSVSGQFETIQRELELAADPAAEMQTTADTRIVLRARFDSELGYPREFRRTVMGSGPEISWRVTRFTPVP